MCVKPKLSYQKIICMKNMFLNILSIKTKLTAIPLIITKGHLGISKLSAEVANHFTYGPFKSEFLFILPQPKHLNTGTIAASAWLQSAPLWP